jgi:uncharacterized protein YegL
MPTKRYVVLGALLALLSFSLVGLAAPQSVMLILDASNSMNTPFGTTTRIEAAKTALDQLLKTLPADIDVGLTVFGEKVSKDNPEQSCQDIESLFPIAPYTAAVKEKMLTTVQSVTAQGMTPLGQALRSAADALSSLSGCRAIILVSDGEGNCNGGQMDAAEALTKLSPPIPLYIIGMAVSGDSRNALQQMATVTNGEYYDVQDVNQLPDALASAFSACNAPTIPPEYACLGITNVIVGTPGNDTLIGTPGNDLIEGLGGDDLLIGLGGNDVLLGGPGNDVLEGGEGNDILVGGDGNDTLFGGAGNDLLCGNAGNDSLEGEAGDDTLDGGPGCDRLLGGPGSNILYKGDGQDILIQGKIQSGSCPNCLAPASCSASCAPLPCPTGEAIKSVDEGSSIRLHGTVSDGDCNVVKLLWSAPVGHFDDPTSMDPLYTAPMVDCCGGENVRITLQATDSCGAVGKDSFLLHIKNVDHPPLVDAGPDITVDEGTTVQLTCSASDPDGDSLSYHWAIKTGGGVLSDPSVLHPVFTAPMTDKCAGVDVLLVLTATDACGESSSDTLVVHVRNVNKPPVVKLGPTFDIKEGTSKRLTAVASDPECEQLTYFWTASRGSFDDPFAANPVYTAPMTDNCDGENVSISLTVTDPCGASACDAFLIHVVNVNTPPTVKADP